MRKADLNHRRYYKIDGVRKMTKEYRCWNGIRDRCCNPKSIGYKYYGGRGIKFCEEWRGSFASFLDYIGPAPSPKHSIDRINNDGNYEPGNVRWATYKQQANNKGQRNKTSKISIKKMAPQIKYEVLKGNTKLIDYNGTQTTTRELAKLAGVSQSTLRRRIAEGWDLNKIISPPASSRGRFVEGNTISREYWGG